jgi:hypothetical protein
MNEMQTYKINPKIVTMLEKEGYISLIKSRRPLTSLKQDTIEVEHIYECNDFGGHKLISVGINVNWPKYFHYHPEREDLFLISNEETKPLKLAFAYDKTQRFMEKLESKTLTASDFFIVEMVYNHPELSFFTINPYVVHGEFTTSGSTANPKIFVTEPSNLDTNFIDIDIIKDKFK